MVNSEISQNKTTVKGKKNQDVIHFLRQIVEQTCIFRGVGEIHSTDKFHNNLLKPQPDDGGILKIQAMGMKVNVTIVNIYGTAGSSLKMRTQK